MATVSSGCRRCGGQLIRDGEDVTCLQCGSRAVGIYGKNRFYNQHLEEILEDYRKGGRTILNTKWGIPRGSMNRLLLRCEKFVAGDIELTVPQPEDNKLPRLPDFDKSWDVQVQLKWLDIWLYCNEKSKQEAK